MILEQFIKIANYHIVGGDKFLWDCYGTNARFLDFYDDDDLHFSVIFDVETQRVYQVRVGNGTYDYVLFDPEYKSAYFAEAKARSVCLNATELELVEDFMKKAAAIINREPFDDRIDVELNLPDDLLFSALMQAHKADITFNEYIQRVIEEFVYDTDYEDIQARRDNMSNVGDKDYEL